MAPKGNQYAKKLTTPELKKMAYEQYCEHLAKGKTKRSWYFDHPKLSLSWETMEKYIATDPEFDPVKKQIAYSKGYQYWETIAEDLAEGKNKKACVPAVNMIMRNKFGWDKPYGEDLEKARIEEEKSKLDKFLNSIEKST